jgi:3-dehydroquinate synthase
MTKKITVKLSQIKYSIFIGNDSIYNLINKINSHQPNKCLVILDKNVHTNHSNLIRQILAALDCKTYIYIFNALESNKSLSKLNNIYDFLSKNYFSRDCVLIAIGGGITGDIAGFAASSFMRGIPFYQVPTTLLSMVDSSVGGKTGINFDNKKNLIGSFYQPEAVYIYDHFLKTLPAREVICGAGEIFKYAFLADKKNYNILKNNLSKVFSGKKYNVGITIKCCLQIKANIVENDEKETTGLRKILNLGHTFAHAFEVESKHRLKHGEAVICGIFCALYLSNILGYLSTEKLDEVLFDFNFIKPSKLIEKMNVETVYKLMIGDKKNSASKIKLVLLEDIGSIVVDVVTEKNLIIQSIEKTKKLL